MMEKQIVLRLVRDLGLPISEKCVAGGGVRGPRISAWLSALCLAFGLAGSPASLWCDTWTRISDGIFESLPDYEPIELALYRKVGVVVALPQSGDVFVVMNRNYGVFRSQDAGETWKRLPLAPLQGRAYGGFSVSLDAAKDRFAVFMQEANGYGIKAVGGMTLDRGLSWRSIERPDQVNRHDGYTWGGVDWSATEPEVLLGKEHHAWVSIWLSQDKGSTWTKLPFESRNVGVLGPETFMAGVDAFAERGDFKAKPGIYRSGDGGLSWKRVSDVVVSGKTPVSWEDRHYWTCQEGVLVSADDGRTWSLLGSPLPEALYGPYFGRTESELMVVARGGIHISDDLGEQWERVGEAVDGAYDVGNPLASFGWDPAAGWIYRATVGGEVYRMKFNLELQ